MMVKTIFVLFLLAAAITMVVAIVTIIRSRHLRYKPLWLIGSLFGFVGLGIDWTIADDLYLQMGIQIPILNLQYFPPVEGMVLKTLFPVIALVAIVKERSERIDDTEVFK